MKTEIEKECEKTWEGFEPAPIEYLHGELMNLFHEFRIENSNSITVEIHGGQLTEIIAKAKKRTYEKYQKLNLKKPIKKTDL